MLAGFYEVDFTPAPGLALLGQMHERRATHARDPLCANAAAFAAGAELPVVLVSVDVCLLELDFVQAAQVSFEAQTGLPGQRLLIHATHTHVAPCTTSFLFGPCDSAFLAALEQAVVAAAVGALERLQPVTLSAGTGHMGQMGWNRRAMFADGSSTMYGHSLQPGFVAMEGPRDPDLPLIVARDEQGQVTGVVLSFSTHPNSLEGESCYSADVPGEVRRCLRAAYGRPVGVVYLTAAAGNTAPSLLDPFVEQQPWRGELGVRRSGHYLAGVAMATIAEAWRPMPATLALAQRAERMSLRPWPKVTERHYPDPLRSDTWPGARPYYAAEQERWTLRPAVEVVRLNALRLGDAVICTCPAELFVEFGLAIREASPATTTLVAELTDGYVGYVPTSLAFSRGGYETWACYSSRMELTAGGKMVAGWHRALEELWAAGGAARS